MNKQLKLLNRNFKRRGHKQAGLAGLARRKRLEDMLEYLIDENDVSFPNTAIDALDVILTRMFRKESNGAFVLLEGRYNTTIEPMQVDLRHQKYIYNLDFLQERFFIASTPVSEGRKVIDISLRLDPFDHFSIVATLDNKIVKTIERKKKYDFGNDSGISEGDWLPTCQNMREWVFNHFSFVGVKETSVAGRMKFGMQGFSFGREYAQRHLFIFHHEDNTYFFDEEGSEIHPTTINGAEFNIKKVAERKLRVKHEYDDFDSQKYSELAKSYIEELWACNPEAFLGGKRLMVKGSFKDKLNGKGELQLAHYVKTNRYSVGVSAANSSREVEVYWRGPYLLVYLEGGRLLNAYTLPTPGILNIRSEKFGAEEVVYVRNINLEKGVRNYDLALTIDGMLYRFSRPELRDLIKSFHSESPKALLAHLGLKEGDHFKMLVKSETQIDSYQLRCIGSSRIEYPPI